jgi:hypothetical protein
MTYDLRRRRLHGPIERIPQSRRYRVTDLGLRVALFFTKVHSRNLRPAGVRGPVRSGQTGTGLSLTHADKILFVKEP